MLCLYRYSYSAFMVAVVIRAGRLLEHVMRLAALSPDCKCRRITVVFIDKENKNFEVRRQENSSRILILLYLN